MMERAHITITRATWNGVRIAWSKFLVTNRRVGTKCITSTVQSLVSAESPLKIPRWISGPSIPHHDCSPCRTGRVKVHFLAPSIARCAREFILNGWLGWKFTQINENGKSKNVRKAFCDFANVFYARYAEANICFWYENTESVMILYVCSLNSCANKLT